MILGTAPELEREGPCRGFRTMGQREMLSCDGEEKPPSSDIHQCWSTAAELERECFLNEYRAIFNPGIQCCSFVLVTLFICGWWRRGEEGRALEHVAPS